MNTTKSAGHKLLVDAAKRIFNGKEEFSCLAIRANSLVHSEISYCFYAELFNCQYDTFFDLYKAYFPEDYQDIHGDENPENYELSDPIGIELREIRILALLFAAAIYKTDGNIME